MIVNTAHNQIESVILVENMHITMAYRHGGFCKLH